MIRAAASGRVDYSKADSDSVRWLLKERMMILKTEREAKLQRSLSRHKQMTATTTWPADDKKGEIYKHHFELSSTILDNIESLLLPYDKMDKKEYNKREMKQMRAEYIAAYGDARCPEAKLQARKDSVELERQRAESRQKMTAEIEATQKRAEQLTALRDKRSRRRRR